MSLTKEELHQLSLSIAHQFYDTPPIMRSKKRLQAIIVKVLEKLLGT